MTTKKKIIFWLMLLTIPFVLLGVAEVAVRLVLKTPIVTDPFLAVGSSPTFFDKTMINGEPHYRVSHSQAYRGRNIVFPIKKHQNTLRVFCVGGSASAGWPHPKEEIYSAYLEKALQAAFPNHAIEVVNVSAHAYASYRVRPIFDAVIQYDPDLVIVFSGNNEFLEKRSYKTYEDKIDKFLLSINNLALSRLIRYLVMKVRHPESTLAGSGRQHINYEVWSKVAREALTLRKDAEQYAQLKRHYAFNIQHMVTSANRKDIPVILLTVPVNLRDWHPNVSYNSLTGEELKKWRQVYERGRRALALHQLDEAIRLFRDAIAMDPVPADSYYYLAQAFEENGESTHALFNYSLARDLDHNPFRAVSEFNSALRSVARDNQNAYLADADASFISASTPYAPGFDLLLDYVHPTKIGNLIIAEVVFDTIVRSKIFGVPGGEQHFVYEMAVPPDVGSLYSETTDNQMQRSLVVLFAMMHQYESMVEKAERYLGYDNPDRPVMKEVLKVFPDYLELRQKQILGETDNSDGTQRVKIQVKKFYEWLFPNLEYEIPDRAF